MSRSTAFWGASLTLCGCLVPAPVEEEEVPPNYPPSFAPERVTPPYEQVVLYDPQVSTEPIEFQVPGVTDIDAGDRVYWRWFINYDARFPKIDALGPTLGREAAPPGVDVSFSVLPCVDFASFGDRIVQRVTVVATDRPFVDDDDESQTRHRTVATGAGHFALTWFVSVDLSTCPSVP